MLWNIVVPWQQVISMQDFRASAKSHHRRWRILTTSVLLTESSSRSMKRASNRRKQSSSGALQAISMLLSNKSQVGLVWCFVIRCLSIAPSWTWQKILLLMHIVSYWCIYQGILDRTWESVYHHELFQRVLHGCGVVLHEEIHSLVIPVVGYQLDLSSSTMTNLLIVFVFFSISLYLVFM